MACRPREVVLALLLLLGSAGGLFAYGGDTHYYLRFAEALEICFDWDEAHLIASADYLLDKNRTTTAEKDPFHSHNKTHWHAFGHSEERFNQLWERVVAESDTELQLVKLGQFLHFISDWESHYGFGIRMGHGLPTLFGRDPDSIANSRMNNYRMLGQTMNYMMEVCVLQERKTAWGKDVDRYLAELLDELADEPLMEKMFEYNSRKWKTFGVRGKKGKKILARNHVLIEELILRRSQGHPERHVPADFTPGDPERGIPPPIGVLYDKSGELVAVYGLQIQLMPEYDGSELSALEEERFEEAEETDLVDDLEETVQDGREADLVSNVELEVLDGDLEPGGWRFQVRIENLGRGASQPGHLDLFVIDVATEEVLGQTRRSVPALAGREKHRESLFVEAAGEPGRGILVGASLKVQDLSADDNDHWFAPWEEAVRTERRKKKKKKKRAPGKVVLLGSPKVWVDAEGDLWLKLRALVAGGDSSRRLGDVALKLSGGDGIPNYEQRDPDTVWISVADRERRVVLAESHHTASRGPEFCAFMTAGDRTTPWTLEVKIDGGNAQPFAQTFPLSSSLAEALRGFCAGNR